MPHRQRRLKLIGANAAQERLERVNHGQAHGDANRAREIHAKAWMDIMRVSIVVRDNRDMLIPRHRRALCATAPHSG